MADIYDNAIIDYNTINNLISNFRAQDLKIADLQDVAKTSSDKNGKTSPTNLSDLKIVTAKKIAVYAASISSARFNLTSFTSQPVINVSVELSHQKSQPVTSIVFNSSSTSVADFTVYIAGLSQSDTATVHVIAIGT